MNARRRNDGHDDTGVPSTDGPMFYVPGQSFGNRHQARRDRVKYAEILYHASYKSARYWCDKEAKTHGLSGIAVFEHYLCRLSQCGWGSFSVIEADVANGAADIRLDHSAFLLAQAEMCAAKTCYRLTGWFAGMMDWISENTGRPVKTLCCETQCGADGHDHCIFAVRPRLAI
jgi:hypothetical protein